MPSFITVGPGIPKGWPDCSLAHLVNVAEAESCMDLLHNANTIVFGSPTYFGNVSAEFKRFMESTGEFWYKQPECA